MKMAHIVPGLMVLGLVAVVPIASAQIANVEIEGEVMSDPMHGYGKNGLPEGDTSYEGGVNGGTVVVGSASNDGSAVVGNGNLHADGASGRAPLTVTFTATALATGSYIIDFGDGSNSGPVATNGCTSQRPDEPCFSIAHTYSANGTYTATLQPYAACMWSNPRCMMATQLLGKVTIVVGNGDGITYQSEANGAVTMQDGERTTTSGETVIEAQVEAEQSGFFVRLWHSFLNLF